LGSSGWFGWIGGEERRGEERRGEERRERRGGKK